MKIMKGLVCLLSLLIVGTAYASQTRYGVRERSSQEYGRVVRSMILRPSQSEEALVSQFRQWAKQGDTKAFEKFIKQTRSLREASSKTCSDGTILVAGDMDGVCVHPEIIQRKDGLKNNLLHSARNEETLQSIADVFSLFFYPNGWERLNSLKNEKNVAGETPLIAHISCNDLDSFAFLYEGSYLQETAAKIREISVNPSPLVRETLEIYNQEFRERGGENIVGENIVSLVQRSKDSYQKRNVLSLFQEEMPFLL